MQLITTLFPDVLLLEPKVFSDSRGFFLESYNQQTLAQHGIHAEFVQDNHSRSARGTLRGLHFQLQKPQAKLCRVIAGEVLDVAVDIRRGSPTFGQWTSALLTAQNFRQIFVPRGFAHGFLVVSEWAEFLYKCDDFYDLADQRGIAWNDPDLAIEWNFDGEPLLSAKDQNAPRLCEMSDAELPVFVT